MFHPVFILLEMQTWKFFIFMQHSVFRSYFGFLINPSAVISFE